MEFCKQFNAATQKQDGLIIPVVISIYKDRSFTFITKTPPASVLLLKAAGLAKGSPVPNEQKVAKVTMKQVEEIAKTKMPDLNAQKLDSASAWWKVRHAAWESKSKVTEVTLKKSLWGALP